MSSIHSGSASAEPPCSSLDSVQQSWTPSNSVHDRLTVAEGQPESSEAETECRVTTREGWLTFEAYVAWVAAASGVPTTALSTPAADSERAVEDRRSTVIVPSKRKRKATRFAVLRESRRPRLSATVIRRALAKTG